MKKKKQAQTKQLVHWKYEWKSFKNHTLTPYPLYIKEKHFPAKTLRCGGPVMQTKNATLRIYVIPIHSIS